MLQILSEINNGIVEIKRKFLELTRNYEIDEIMDSYIEIITI